MPLIPERNTGLRQHAAAGRDELLATTDPSVSKCIPLPKVDAKLCYTPTPRRLIENPLQRNAHPEQLEMEILHRSGTLSKWNTT